MKKHSSRFTPPVIHVAAERHPEHHKPPGGRRIEVRSQKTEDRMKKRACHPRAALFSRPVQVNHCKRLFFLTSDFCLLTPIFGLYSPACRRSRTRRSSTSAASRLATSASFSTPSPRPGETPCAGITSLPRN